ncbi:5-oxoprolinase subunit C family protein [Ekhidna sp.]
MGKLRVVKTGPVATIQDLGRFGFRRYGIPQSGVMDIEMMKMANKAIGNPDNYPVVEFAMMGIKLEVLEKTSISVIGAALKVNGNSFKKKSAFLNNGDELEISTPDNVYAYLGIGGKIEAKEDFGSFATYPPAGFGGVDGRVLEKEDIIITDSQKHNIHEVDFPIRKQDTLEVIRILKGPEWSALKELPDSKGFQVHPSSNRMGIRLIGERLENTGKEIISSAVIPGTIQLPPDGQPIILMNDCQTTGGYPRIGKVIEEDMGKVAQVKPGKLISLLLN